MNKMGSWITTALVIGSTIFVPTVAFAYTGQAQWTSGVPYNLGAYSDSYAPTSSNQNNASVMLSEGIENSTNLSNQIFVGFNLSDGSTSNQEYWGYNLNGQGYEALVGFPGSPGPGYTPLEIQYIGNNTWAAYINFSQVGSLSATPGSYSMSVGACDSSSTDTFSGQKNSSLEYLSTTGNWYYWTGGSIVYQSPMTASWTSAIITKWMVSNNAGVKRWNTFRIRGPFESGNVEYGFSAI